MTLEGFTELMERQFSICKMTTNMEMILLKKKMTNLVKKMSTVTKWVKTITKPPMLIRIIS
jgi:hypothetical protein